MKKAVLLISLSIFFYGLQAQTLKQQTGWFLFLNSTKLTNKWGLHFDFQVRSTDQWTSIRNVLIRPGLTYYVSKNEQATLGYLFASAHSPLASFENFSFRDALIEHRIWEQYNITHRMGSIFAAHRFRLEQRFIETQGDNIFSQRLRYFFRFIQPLQKKETTFTKGIFAALQNEIFANIQNKKQLNNSFFDQNRAYLALGYRFSPKVDIEAGYLNQFVQGLPRNTLNHAVQLALYTRF